MSAPAGENRLPRYDALQSLFHEAFRAELYGIIDSLPCERDAHVLDVPCGDGFYSARLASRLGGSGRLTVADSSAAYLDEASGRLAGLAGPPALAVGADVYGLPFDDGSFDLVWCAQSLISLDDPGAALAEMVRVTRRGGVLAVLEADEFHHVLLPWPVGLELAVQRAMQAASRARYGDEGRRAPARRVRHLLLGAGVDAPRKKTVPADRDAPFPPEARRFLRRHLEELGDFIRPYLTPAERGAFDHFATPGRAGGVFERRDADLTCVNVVHVGRKPSRGAAR